MERTILHSQVTWLCRRGFCLPAQALPALLSALLPSCEYGPSACDLQVELTQHAAHNGTTVPRLHHTNNKITSQLKIECDQVTGPTACSLQLCAPPAARSPSLARRLFFAAVLVASQFTPLLYGTSPRRREPGPMRRSRTGAKLSCASWPVLISCTHGTAPSTRNTCSAWVMDTSQVARKHLVKIVNIRP